jgi:hypothetical protein
MNRERLHAPAGLAVAIVAALVATAPQAATTRSRATRAAFQASHPCPANGHRRGACPGFVVDHVTPLCAGGADAPSNMQWQTIDAARAKDRAERAQCATLKRRTP